MRLVAVVFDWGGTLTPFHDVDLLDLWRVAARRLVPPHRVEELAQELVRAEARWWRQAIHTGRSGTANEVVSAASAATGLDVAAAVREAAGRQHLEAWTLHTIADPEAGAVLRALRTRGLRIGLLSNTHWPRSWHERWLARDGVLDLLDHCVYTSDLPYMKPHPGAFHAVLSALEVHDPRTTVFVGDRPFDDIWGAQRIGMRTVLLPSRFVPRYDVRPDAVIGRLGHLVDIVDAWL